MHSQLCKECLGMSSPSGHLTAGLGGGSHMAASASQADLVWSSLALLYGIFSILCKMLGHLKYQTRGSERKKILRRMLFPQLTNMGLSLHVLPPSLLPIHVHVETKGENWGGGEKSLIKTTRAICTQMCYACACQLFVYTFGGRILGKVQQ